MENRNVILSEKTALLKDARLKLLQLHKLFVDEERNRFENQNGKVSSGQFLNLLVNDESFQWLRKFSTLIVEIDEMFDLDDGFTEDMMDGQLSQIENLILLDPSLDKEFADKYQRFMQENTEIAVKHAELKQLLTA